FRVMENVPVEQFAKLHSLTALSTHTKQRNVELGYLISKLPVPEQKLDMIGDTQAKSLIFVENSIRHATVSFLNSLEDKCELPMNYEVFTKSFNDKLESEKSRLNGAESRVGNLRNTCLVKWSVLFNTVEDDLQIQSEVLDNKKQHCEAPSA
ncbi:hypothetical protein PMAYCL1PPCAC_29666, partial [Pristionchus mayeri]